MKFDRFVSERLTSMTDNYEGTSSLGGSSSRVNYEGLLSHQVEAKERYAEKHPEEFIPIGNRATGYSSPRRKSQGEGCDVWKGNSPSYPTYGVIGRNPPGWIDLFPLHRPPHWKSLDEERMIQCRRKKQGDQEEWNCAPILCRKKEHKLPVTKRKVVTFGDEVKGNNDDDRSQHCWEKGEHPLYRTSNSEYGRLVSLSRRVGNDTRIVRGKSDLHTPKVIVRNRSLNA